MCVTAWGSCSVTIIEHSELLILIQLNLTIRRLKSQFGARTFKLNIEARDVSKFCDVLSIRRLKSQFGARTFKLNIEARDVSKFCDVVWLKSPLYLTLSFKIG